jgi:hypothetical protein
LDLEIALGGIPTKDQPHGLLQLGQRGVETSGYVIDHSFASPTKICQALLFEDEDTLVSEKDVLGHAKTRNGNSTCAVLYKYDVRQENRCVGEKR